MSIFVRRASPPQNQKGCRNYRLSVRADFCECCAYCLLYEALAGGADNFELDHFRPKSAAVPGSDVHDFFNLYYACHVCNHYKAGSWPSRSLQTAGYRFVNPCSEDFATHFEAQSTGEWKPLTRPAQYSQARLRLNRRHLVELRSLLNELAGLEGKPPIDWGKPSKGQLVELFP